MAERKTTILWNRNGAAFTDNRYSRGHRWLFDGGVEVPASSCPQIIPPPLSMEAAVDPEEAFVVSLSSCHMLWFLSVAAKRGFAVESYRDEAVGTMMKDAFGKVAMTRIILRPEVRFSDDHLPTSDELTAIHHEAHDCCYLANSVKTEVRCESVSTPA